MDDDFLFGHAYEGNAEFFAAMAQYDSRGRGFSAAVVPACPERSVLNCVSYADVGCLDDALPSIANFYEVQGVLAWTVWVPAGDRPAAELLAEAGHRLDGSPEAMGLVLADLAVGAPAEETTDSSAVGPINDAAYGYVGSFTAALKHGLQDRATRTYVADHGGRAAACVVTLDVGADCHVGLVATLPEAQRRKLAGNLLAGALSAARERGQRTSTLIASSAGRPVYERLGYRPLGAIEMWERRQA